MPPSFLMICTMSTFVEPSSRITASTHRFAKWSLSCSTTFELWTNAPTSSIAPGNASACEEITAGLRAARAEGGAHLRVVRAMLRRSSRNASGSALLSSTPSFSSACAEHGAPTQ